MADFLADNPGAWVIPDDVRRRAEDQRQQIDAARSQAEADERAVQEAARALLGGLMPAAQNRNPQRECSVCAGLGTDPWGNACLACGSSGWVA